MKLLITVITAVFLYSESCLCDKGNFYLSYKNGSELITAKAGAPPNTVGLNWIVKAYYNNSVNTTGWDILEITTNPDVDDSDQAFYAGWIEGFLTQKHIYYHWYNTQRTLCDKIPKTCANIRVYLHQNLNWINKQIKNNEKDPYWYQVSLFYQQVNGLFKGYTSAVQDTKETLSYEDILWVNYVTDLMTLVESVANKTEAKNIKKSGHCSVLIKLLPGYSDVLFAHNAWISYNYMNRAIKRYNFAFHWSKNSVKLIPGKSQAFSSYAGVISSMDDFYIINSGLFVTETTNNVYNMDIYSNNKPVGQILETVRSVVANRLATDGKSWSYYYSLRNSGTYNNQWMVVDLTKFKPGFEPLNGFLWVLEQMPGKIVSFDQTQHILTHSYWASYNIPFYKDIYHYSGYDKMEQKYGDYYSYSSCVRAKIFKREQEKVIDLDTMYKTIRYNHYKTDPYSKCQQCTPQPNACLSVASRCDLNPKNGNYTMNGLKFNMFGAIDAKIGSYSMFQQGKMVSVNGPTWNDHVSPFQWSQAQPNNVSHLGQPDRWDFTPIITSWIQPYQLANTKEKETIIFKTKVPQ